SALELQQSPKSVCFIAFGVRLSSLFGRKAISDAHKVRAVIIARQVAPMLFQMISKHRARFIGLFLAIIGASASFAQQEDQVALLIGNASYPDTETTLKDPVTDAGAFGNV